MSPQGLLAVAARQMSGVRRVYRALSEMAHFGSTALWTPFHIEDAEDGHFRFGTSPHWHRPKEARIAVATLLENGAAALTEMAAFAQDHIVLGVLAALRVGQADPNG